MSGNDPLRSGWYPNQPGLNPSVGGGCAFGEQWSAPVDGQVYGAPLVDMSAGPNGTLLVATETNHVYGFDAVTGQQLWARSDLGPPWNPNDLGCGVITPSVGITSTPAIDTATHTAYLLSKTYVSGPAQWKAHAIDHGSAAQPAHSQSPAHACAGPERIASRIGGAHRGGSRTPPAVVLAWAAAWSERR